MQLAVRRCYPYFLPAALFSAGVNILYLASPLYMLQVYDRVVSSGSVPTLVMLTLALIIALAGDGRARPRPCPGAGARRAAARPAAVRAGHERRWCGRPTLPPGAAKSQALRDLDTFRQFLTGGSFYALFDAPWAPLYMVVLALLAPAARAYSASIFALILLALALVNEWMTGRLLGEAGEAATRNYAFTEATLRNSHAIEAMGMLDALLKRWSHDRNGMLGGAGQGERPRRGADER